MFLLTMVGINFAIASPYISNSFLSSLLFRELRSLFVYEFVCSLQEEEIDKLFAESLSCLLRISAISLDNDHIIVEEEQILKQIALLMQPFIARYYCVMQCLVQLVGTQFTNEVLFEESLQLAVNLFARQQGNSTSRSVCITSDITRNALLAFCRLQAICRRVSLLKQSKKSRLTIFSLSVNCLISC